MRAWLLGAWQQARSAQRLGYLVGGALILVGLGHLAAWLVVGGAWAGPVSLRKPTTFGISFGLTTITLAWVTGHLRITDRTRWLLLGPLAAATSYEVAWVVVQNARGTPAHFNDTTPLGRGAVHRRGGDGRHRHRGDRGHDSGRLRPHQRPGAAGGGAPLGAGGVAGRPGHRGVDAGRGLALLDADADPTTQSMSTWGAAGSMKFAHAVPMHAIDA
jgi:hypothetical protein